MQIIGIGFLLCVGIVILYWVYLSHTIPKPFIVGIEGSEFANSVSSLSALFSGLAIVGVLLTIYIQVTDSNKAAEALTNSSEALLNSANESKEKAILDLYQTFCSRYFQEIKTSSHKVLISAVQCKNYCDFMISRFFVIGENVKYFNYNVQYKKYETFKVYKSLFPNDSKPSDKKMLKKYIWSENKYWFEDKEREDRFKLDELINFFILLANKKSSEDIIKGCDFFYDWWRPLFWFISIQQEEYYKKLKNKYDKDLENYCKEPKFVTVVVKLDKIYGYNNEGFLKEKNLSFWKYFLNHPKIKSYKYDKKYDEYLVSN